MVQYGRECKIAKNKNRQNYTTQDHPHRVQNRGIYFQKHSHCLQQGVMVE